MRRVGVGFDFSEEGGKDAYALQNKVQESDGCIERMVQWSKTYGMFGWDG